MSDDVLITPASRKIEFKDNSGNVDGKIELDANGNLNITSPGGDIGLGDATADVYIGDGTNNVDIVFEQNGEIRGLTGRTLTLGQSDSNVTITAQNFTANGLSYPTSDGTNGQVLTTDGSGGLSFSTISSSGAYDLNGGRLTLDADGDTYLEAASDDYLTFSFLNNQKYFMNQSMFGPVTGVTNAQLGSSSQSWSFGWLTNLYSTTVNATTYNIQTGGNLIFEGSTSDNFETTLTVADPTADRTITLPNATGTVLLTDGDGSNLTGIEGFAEDSTTKNLSAGTGANDGSLASATSAVYNIAIGQDANGGDTNYSQKTVAIGYEALKVNTDNYETAVGHQALLARSSTYLFPCAAFGNRAGSRVTSGSANTYLGPYNYGCTTGEYNTAVGSFNHQVMTSGEGNAAVGYFAGADITTGDNNVTIGYLTGQNLTTSDDNILIGREAGEALTGFGQDDNIAIGAQALHSSTSSQNSVAVGRLALGGLAPGDHNTGIGDAAGSSLSSSSSYNTFVGSSAGAVITTGAKNTILGGYNGNEGGLDIRTSSNRIVLSDGDGNPRLQINGQGDMKYPGSNAESIFTSDHSGSASATNRRGMNASGDQLIIHSGSGTADIDAIKLYTSHGGAVGSSFAKLAFLVQSDGDVQNKNNSYGQISDQRLKQDIVDAASQWDDIKALQVKKFRFIDAVTNLGSDNVPLQIGVIAQDLEAANMSGLVVEKQDVIDGVDQGTTTKSVKYSVLYMKAVKALQEAMERIETLEAQVTDLTARVTALEGATE